MNPLVPKLVSEVMSMVVVTLYEEDDPGKVEEAMAAFHFRHVPVVDEKRLVGLVTHRDLLRFSSSSLDPTGALKDQQMRQGLFVRDLMTTDIVTVTPETPLLAAVRLMHDRKIGCLPVVDGEELVGMLTDTDVLAVTIRLLEGAP